MSKLWISRDAAPWDHVVDVWVGPHPPLPDQHGRFAPDFEAGAKDQPWCFATMVPDGHGDGPPPDWLDPGTCFELRVSRSVEYETHPRTLPELVEQPQVIDLMAALRTALAKGSRT